jgi:hypothetical protein
MSTASTIQDVNRELARQINEEALQNPQSKYANKFVGIANGQVVVVGDDLDDVLNQLRRIEPDPTRTFFLGASEDPNVVHEIWSQY